MRWAILDADGVVQNVIVADQEFADTYSRDRGVTLVEVAWPTDKDRSPTALVTHDCEPGSTFDAKGRAFTKSAAQEKDRLHDEVIKVLVEQGLVAAPIEAVAVDPVVTTKPST